MTRDPESRSPYGVGNGPLPPTKRSKYGAKKTVVDGIRFDSIKEARRWTELLLLQGAGEIRNLQRQVPISLQGQNAPILTPTGRQMKYKADFTYEDSRLNWATVIEDAKGYPTPEYKVKRAILAAMGIEVTEV
jgi:hypothetical protein